MLWVAEPIINTNGTVKVILTLGVDSERLSSRTSFQLEDEVLDTSEP